MTTPEGRPEPVEPPVTRVRYFDGQFLTDEDLTTDQDYHVGHTRGLARTIKARGIVGGLEVSALTVTPPTLQITAGRAVDGAGRALCLRDDVTVHLDGGWTGTPIHVYLAYRRRPERQVASGSSSTEYARWIEEPLLVVVCDVGMVLAVHPDGTPDVDVTWHDDLDRVQLATGIVFDDSDPTRGDGRGFLRGEAGTPFGITVPTVNTDRIAAGPAGSVTVDAVTSLFRAAPSPLWQVGSAAGRPDGLGVNQNVIWHIITAPSDGILHGLAAIAAPTTGGSLVMWARTPGTGEVLSGASVRGQGWDSFTLPVAGNANVELAITMPGPIDGTWEMTFRWTGIGSAVVPLLGQTFMQPSSVTIV